MMVLALVAGAPTSSFAQHDHGPNIPAAGGLPHGIPDLCAKATIVSAASGAWSNPGTWNLARVPAAGDKVSISSSHAVSYDTVSNASLNCVEVRGQLAFRTDIDTRITVGTLLVYSNGLLQIGTPAAPVAASVKAEVVIADQPLNTTADPEQFGTGIIGVGKITISGQPRTPFARLTSEAAAGATTLTTAQSLNGWQVGDKLFLPDARHLTDTQRTTYSPQWEERTAASVGTTAVTVSSPLSFLHEGARDGAGALTFLPHVANLSRNVIIRSANPGGTRGHILFSIRAAIDIRYALLKDLGRTTTAPLDNTTFDASGHVTHVGTNQIGRYPLHLHHLMGPNTRTMGSVTKPFDGFQQYRLIGNAIDGGKKWGITVHNTHFGLVQQNVVYNVDGAGIVTEDGSESYNMFEGNFVARINGPGGRGDERGLTDMGWEGTGFWLRGTNNNIRDNVVVNVLTDYGFKYFSYLIGNVNIPKFPGADTTVASQVNTVLETTLPIKIFARNEVYGASQGGLTYWWISTQENNPTPGPGLNASTNNIKNFHVWHVWNNAIYNYPSNALTIDGLVVRGKSPSQSAYSRGLFSGDYAARNLLVTNADIQGMMYGIVVSTNANGGTQVIQNSYLRNAKNISIETQWTAVSDARNIGPRKVVIRNVRFDTPVIGVPQTPLRAIEFAYSAGAVRNLIQKDDIYVYEFNGNASDNFKAYYAQQLPGFLVPQTVISQYNTHYVEGAPVAGLTNQQTWNAYGIAIGGSVAPCTTTRPNNDGVACPIPWAPPSGSVELRSEAPSPPRNVTIRH
jgi:G8 domain-containing protein